MQTHDDFEFFCPGPVNIDNSIKKEITKLSSHRSNDFTYLIKECFHNTLKMFNVNSDYSSLFLCGSGTLSIESIIYSYLRYKKVLLLTNGFFGERWNSMLEHYSCKFKCINFKWNEEFDYNIIENELINKYDCLFFVHHETSTTMINDINKLNEICKKTNTNIVMDSVSSVGIYNINLMKYDMISALGFSTNKCMGSYPGLCVVVIKNDILELMPKSPSYLNLYNYYEYIKNYQTPFTPCIQNFYAYNIILKNKLDNTLSIESHYDDLMNYFKKKLLEKNLLPILKNNQSNWVINIYHKHPLNIYNKLYSNKIVIYRCKKNLYDNAIQIAIYNKTKKDIDKLISLM